jgi:hypothetical protein
MVDIQDSWTLKPQCDNDQFIMQDMAKHLQLKPAELKRMNTCRMYLQVVMLADMVDGSREKVLPEYLKGQHHPDCCSVYEWPYQETPNNTTWKRWAWNLRKLYLKPYTKWGELHTPLGRWLQASPIHQKWRDYIDLDDETAPHLIQMDWSPHNSGEVMFAYPESNHSQFCKTGAIVVLNQPQQMHPTMVLHETLVYLISGYSQIMLEDERTNEVVHDGIHPLLRTIQVMPAAYRGIIGVC